MLGFNFVESKYILINKENLFKKLINPFISQFNLNNGLMIIFDSDEDIKFLDEFWDNNSGRYSNYVQKKNNRYVKDRINSSLLKYEKKNSRRNINSNYVREPYFPIKRSSKRKN